MDSPAKGHDGAGVLNRTLLGLLLLLWPAHPHRHHPPLQQQHRLVGLAARDESLRRFISGRVGGGVAAIRAHIIKPRGIREVLIIIIPSSASSICCLIVAAEGPLEPIKPRTIVSGVATTATTLRSGCCGSIRIG